MTTTQSPGIDLAKCFNGDQQLVTWNIAYRALCDPKTASNSKSLRAFLTAADNVEILSKPWKPFPVPSPQEKSKFDAKTAPINVTPTQNAHYDISQIKEDSLWLSKEAQISEYVALQLVVQEWQNRPTFQLLSGLTEEEALSVQAAAGITNLGASTFNPNSSILSTPLTDKATQFDSQAQRRLRIIETYHTTCASILRISQLLVSWGAAPSLRSQTIYSKDYHSDCAGWIEDLGQTVTSSSVKGKVVEPGAQVLDECLKAVQKRCEAVGAGYVWTVDESIIEAAAETWVVAQSTEILHLLHLALTHADLVHKRFLPAASIEDWLKFFMQVGFFRDIAIVTPRQEPLIPIIQLLTSLLSLAILSVDQIMSDLDSEDFKSWDQSSYILNTNVVSSITAIFGEAKLLGACPATAPMFAWALLTWRLTSVASHEEQERELLLEAPGNSYMADRGKTPVEGSAQAVAELANHEWFDSKMPFQDLAEASSEDGVLVIVGQLLEVALPAFGTHVDQISRDRMRLIFLQLIRAALNSEVVGYVPDIIITTLTILAGDRTFRTWADGDDSRHADPIVSYFLEDEHVLRPALLRQARMRYPYEMTPFLKFCSALTRGDNAAQNGVPTFVDTLVSSNELMQRLPQGFAGYANAREEENANWVELTEFLPLFVKGSAPTFPTQRLLQSSTSNTSDGLLVIPPGTQGIVVDDSSVPYVAVWHFEHSTLTLLVQLLSTYPVGSNTVETSTQKRASRENVLEIIGLFADLISSSVQSTDGVGSPELLEALNINIGGGQDSVSMILAIFEQELLQLSQEPSNETSLELLINCTQFLEGLTKIAPQRVWPWLARSRLLEGDGNGGSLATILIGTEMVLGRYDFLIGCIRLYGRLIADAVDQSVARKSPTKALSRFNATAPSESGTSEKVMSTILFTFGRTLTSIYESSLSWKYARLEHRPELNIAICEIFTTILKLAYGMDDTPQLSAKLSRAIAPVAEYITQMYLTHSDESIPTNPILSSLVIGVSPAEGTILTSVSRLWAKQTQTTLALADVLVRTAALLDRPWTHLEQQLFKATPLLARLYGSSDSWKSQVVRLLESLVRGAIRVTEVEKVEVSANGAAHLQQKGSDQKEPPSLLGHLGPRTAKNFLSVLSQLDEPLGIVDIQTHVWNLLSAVVTCKQQWFSLYLLTGSTPRESMRSKSDSAPGARSKALLTRALDSISALVLPENNSIRVAWPLYTSMLEFVSSAQNNWSWAMSDLRQQKEFIQKLVSFLKWMAKQPQVKSLRTNNEILDRSYQNRFASLAAELIAMYLHSARKVGDVTVLKDIVPSLAYLENTALELPSYNESLHGNLKRNIERTFPGVTLANLKRTTLFPESFGRSFFYDVDFAKRLLGFDSKWSGPRDGTGFASEVERANFDLGLVESQVQLIQSWKLLGLELSHVCSKDERVARILIDMVKKCMIANTDSILPEALFGQLILQRADLAFTLLKRLVEAKTQLPEARQLLTPVWNAIRRATPDFENVFSSDSVSYHRSLLRILYLTLHFHMIEDTDQSETATFRSSFRGTVPKSHNDLTESISTQLLEILSDTVAQGFRSLATQIHADPSSVSPSDFALLTALLQRIIAIPEMAMWQSQAGLLFANSNTVRYATSLFSWSDRLTIKNNGIDDPIYGELSLLFLLSLSSIQSLAETMAVDGVLSQLNTANLMNYYRRPNGMGPFDTPARLHSIWTKGILPLCLNLLLSVGPPIAAEISSFLNQFPTQLERASYSINSNPSSRQLQNTKITLSVASEIHSLALISSIIDNVRRQGPKLGIQANDVPVLEWDKENVKEDVESWLGRKGVLRERVVAMNEREVEMVARTGSSEGGNELEDRVLGELESAGVCLGVGGGNGGGK